MEATKLSIKDLMVGDWVHLISTIHNVSFPDNEVIQDEGYTTIRTPIKITTVSENCVSYYSNKLEVYITLSNEDIEPIQLTPEILEKNGFVLDELIKDCSIYNGIENRVILHNDKEYINSDNEWHVHIDNEDYCSIASCELTYVHELQNILRLCKINNEIII